MKRRKRNRLDKAWWQRFYALSRSVLAGLPMTPQPQTDAMKKASELVTQRPS